MTAVRRRAESELLADAIAACEKRMKLRDDAHRVLIDAGMRRVLASAETVAGLRHDTTALFPSGVVDGAIQAMFRSSALPDGSTMLNKQWAAPGPVCVGGQDPGQRLFNEWCALCVALRRVTSEHSFKPVLSRTVDDESRCRVIGSFRVVSAFENVSLSDSVLASDRRPALVSTSNAAASV